MIATETQQIDQMQRELARLERHAMLIRLAVALGFPRTEAGVWFDYPIGFGRVSTGLLPPVEGEFAQELSTTDLTRIESLLEAA